MYPFYRFGKTFMQALLKKYQGNRLAITDTSSIDFACNFSDIDGFYEMNNGRVLTLYDLGRTDFIVRSDIGKILLKKRWSMVVAGNSTRYRSRVRPNDIITMRTKLVGVDERWLYFSQSMWVKDKPASSMLLRAGITSKGRVIGTANLLNALGQPNFKLPPDVWVQAWIDAEAKRPWPP